MSSFNSEEYLEALQKVFSLEFKDYDDFKRKYGKLFSGKCEVFVPISMVCDLFDAAGFLLHNGLMEYDTADQFPVTSTWNRVKPIVEGVRKEFSNPSHYMNFEYLYNEVKKREQKLQQSKA
jgi:hypothetical protein